MILKQNYRLIKVIDYFSLHYVFSVLCVANVHFLYYMYLYQFVYY